MNYIRNCMCKCMNYLYIILVFMCAMCVYMWMWICGWYDVMGLTNDLCWKKHTFLSFTYLSICFINLFRLFFFSLQILKIGNLASTSIPHVIFSLTTALYFYRSSPEMRESLKNPIMWFETPKVVVKCC